MKWDRTLQMRSNVTNEIDNREYLKLGENKIEVWVYLSPGFSTYLSSYPSISSYSGSLRDLRNRSLDLRALYLFEQLVMGLLLVPRRMVQTDAGPFGLWTKIVSNNIHIVKYWPQ